MSFKQFKSILISCFSRFEFSQFEKKHKNSISLEIFQSLDSWSRNRTGENRTSEPRPLEWTFLVRTSVDTFVGRLVGAFVGVLQGLKTGQSNPRGRLSWGALVGPFVAHSWTHSWTHSRAHSWVRFRFRLFCASPNNANT